MIATTRHGFLIALITVHLMTACGHDAPVRNPRQDQAVELNQRAQRAYQRGEYRVALGLYEQALQLDSAIENVDGIAVNLLNLAKVSQALGESANSKHYLDQLLQDKALSYPAPRLASAALQYGLLSLLSGDLVNAKSWADKATGLCVAGCNLSGVIANLRANIAVHSADADQALYWSERAVAANRDEAQIEYANALRLLAQSKWLGKDPASAVPILEESLAIDKKLGLPDKIVQDLSLLALAHQKMGSAEQANIYRERATRIEATLVK
jgi:tetratricopeptide (TPR) repeat protein